MIVEILNVGTELLLGEIVNTNATYIQKMCKELGFNVYFQSVVGDNQQRVKDCLDLAFKRGANCVITTGGLGPTQDDLTKELSAEYLGLEMLYNETEAKKVEDKCKFVTVGGDISDNNFKQAYFPKGCYILENEVGTANGCVMSKDEKMIINLPGPPKEMMHVVDHILKPYLEQYKQDIIYTYDYLTMGVGESRIDDLLADVIEHQNSVSIALYASEESVRIRLGCKASNQQMADAMMEETKQAIEDKIGNFIVKEHNLKEALKRIMPPYYIEYVNDFRLRDDFKLGNTISNSNESLKISVGIKKHRLGEIVDITFNYLGKSEQFEIPMLKKAELSYSKLEGRIIANMYTFLQNQ